MQHVRFFVFFSHDHPLCLINKIIVDGIHLSDEKLQKARDNDGRALYDIGDIYFKKRSYNKALLWFCKAAFKNLSNAQNRIGFMYHYGKGVSKDYKKAMEWYLTAAHNDGLSSAQNNIGLLYRNGQGVPQDNQNAIYWYKKSADQNNEIAQYNLGLLFEFELDVKDLQQAVDWYQRAVNNGYKKAKRDLEALKKQGYYSITGDKGNDS